MGLLEGKKIIVTGGSRGIGKAIVEELASAGAIVAFSYSRNQESATKILNGLPGSGHFTFALNLQEADKVESQIQSTIETLGGLDGLVNNAGITKDQILLRMKTKDFTDVIETNLQGTFLCCKSVLKKMMKARSGSIVNLSSVIAHSGNSGQANYAASKAGIEAFTRSLSQEMASRNIRANCVAPGFIETEMTASLPEEVKEGIVSSIPLGRIAKPAEVAKVVKFLLSDEASYITGQSIHVNGGLRM